MKKVRICLAFCMMLTLLFGACGTEATGHEPTSAPKLTEALEETKVPEATEVPEVTAPAENAEEMNEAPTATEVPVATEAPKVTEVPMLTEAPEATKAPKATATPRPTVAPKPTATPRLKPTATSRPTPKPTPVAYKTMCVDFNDSDKLEYMMHYGCSYNITSDGILEIQYDNQYADVRWELKEKIDTRKCQRIVVRVKSEYESIAIKLYDEQIFSDEWCDCKTVYYGEKADGIVEYEIYPKIMNLSAIGIMSLEQPKDASKYKVSIYEIVFEMDVEEDVSENEPIETYSPIVSDLSGSELKSKWEKEFVDLTLSPTLKKIGYDAPALTQHYGADPCAMVYDGRVYVYMTGEKLAYKEDGKVIKNPCKQNSLFVMSSADLINWTDHGEIYIGGRQGIERWVQLAWAPTAIFKEIDGKTKFFVYYSANCSSIEVLVGDSPIGPFYNPLEESLISYETPNCDGVILFDPAVLMDDDGNAYLYFGGGDGTEEYTRATRVVKLGEDMISIVGEPVTIEVPYLFEDSAINKIGDTYYYSYCTGFEIEESSRKKYGMEGGQIVYATSDNPMGPFIYQGAIFNNPGEYFPENGGNNHHSIFEFEDEFYITYHARLLCNEAGLTGLDYRSSQVAKLSLNEAGEFETLQELSRQSIEQVKCLNPYEKVEAETMATMGGVGVTPADAISKKFGIGNMEISDIQSGDWVALYGVDFGNKGATKFTAAVRAKKGGEGAIQIRLDEPDGEVVGYLDAGIGADGVYYEITADLLKKITGEHTLVFVFWGEGLTLDYWKFQ